MWDGGEKGYGEGTSGRGDVGPHGEKGAYVVSGEYVGHMGRRGDMKEKRNMGIWRAREGTCGYCHIRKDPTRVKFTPHVGRSGDLRPTGAAPWVWVGVWPCFQPWRHQLGGSRVVSALACGSDGQGGRGGSSYTMVLSLPLYSLPRCEFQPIAFV